MLSSQVAHTPKAERGHVLPRVAELNGLPVL